MGRKRFLGIYGYVLGSFLVLLSSVVFHILSGGYFFDLGNIMDLLRHGAVMGILALGLSFVIIGGEFDISFANLTAFAGVIIASCLLKWRWNTGLAFIISFALVMCFGLINGFAVAYLKYPSMAVTLAAANVALGLNYVISGGRPIYGNLPQSFRFLGVGSIGLIPFPVFILLFSYILAYIVVHRTRWGQHLYAVGEKPNVAFTAGINPHAVKSLTFLISACTAFIGGAINVAWIGSGQPVVGPPYLIEAFAAVFLGAALNPHGKPNIPGTFIGTLLSSSVFNGVTLMGLPYYLHQIINGCILLISLLLRNLLRRRAL